MGLTCSRIVFVARRPPSTKKERRRAKVNARKAEKKAKKMAKKESPRTLSIPTPVSTGHINDDGRDVNIDEGRRKNNTERAEHHFAKMAEINKRRTDCPEAKTAKDAKEATCTDHSQKIRPTPAPRSKEEKLRPTPAPRPEKFQGVDKDDMVVVELDDSIARKVVLPVSQPNNTPMVVPETNDPAKLSLINQGKGDIPFPAYRFLRGAKRDKRDTDEAIVGVTQSSPRQAANRDDTVVSSHAASARYASPPGGSKSVDDRLRNKAVRADDPVLYTKISPDNLVGHRFTHTDVSTVEMSNAYQTSVIGTRGTRIGPLDQAARAACMNAYISGTVNMDRDPFTPWRSATHGYIQDGRVMSYNTGMISRTRPSDMQNPSSVPVNRQDIRMFENAVDHLIAVQTAEGEGVVYRDRNRSLRNARGVGPISRQVDPNRPVMSTLHDDRPQLRSQRPNLTVPGLPSPMSECLDRFAQRHTRRTPPSPRH